MLQRWRQALFQNLGLKVAAITLAVAVYAHVFSREERIMVYACPLELHGLAPGLTYTGEVPSHIRVKVRARGTDLIRLRDQAPSIVVRLNEARPGLLQRPLSAEDVVFPPGLTGKVEQLVERTTLSLEIEPVRRKTLRIRPSLRGSPAPGFALTGRPRANPDTLTVRGPASLVQPLDSLRTEEIELGGRNSSVEETVAVELPAGVRPQHASTKVRIGIARSPS